ncbi:MAG: T9SS type A sorting domain-containing protein [Bacteroidota bacterium]
MEYGKFRELKISKGDYLRIKPGISDDFRLKLLDISGKVVDDFSITGERIICVKGLKPGLYFAVVTCNSGNVEVKKFLKSD